MNGIGGVQTFCQDFLIASQKYSHYKHVGVFPYKPDTQYNLKKANYFIVTNEILKNIVFLYNIKFKRYPLVLHNALISYKIKLLLKIIRPHNLIFYEHGGLWNVNKNNYNIYKNNLMQAKSVFTNSNATKFYLCRRFNYPQKKVNVLYYSAPTYHTQKNSKKRNPKNFTVGYLGRFDAHKGISLLKKIANECNEIQFLYAGDGPLLNYLKEDLRGQTNVKFHNRITEPLSFIDKCDVLLIPSIREPFGRVILECGLVSKVAMASNIDGIPEAMGIGNGILLQPKKKIDQSYFKLTNSNIPDYVYDPISKKLVKPTEITVNDIKDRIIELQSNLTLCEKLGNKLNDYVIKNFSKKREFSNWDTNIEICISKRK